MAFGEDETEIDYMLKDAGVEIILGAERAFGVFDEADDVAIVADGAGYQKRSTSVVVKRGALAGLVEGATVTIDGDAYRVRDVARRDGSRTLLTVTLAPVSG